MFLEYWRLGDVCPFEDRTRGNIPRVGETVLLDKTYTVLDVIWVENIPAQKGCVVRLIVGRKPGE